MAFHPFAYVLIVLASAHDDQSSLLQFARQKQKGISQEVSQWQCQCSTSDWYNRAAWQCSSGYDCSWGTCGQNIFHNMQWTIDCTSSYWVWSWGAWWPALVGTLHTCGCPAPSGLLAVNSVTKMAESSGLLAVNNVTKMGKNDDKCGECEKMGHSCFSEMENPSTCFSPGWKEGVSGQDRCTGQFKGIACKGVHSRKTCKKRGHSCFIKGWADPCLSPAGGKAECTSQLGWAPKGKKTPKGKWLGNPLHDTWTEAQGSPSIVLEDGDDRRTCKTCEKMGHSCLAASQQSPCFSPGWEQTNSTDGLTGSERCKIEFGGILCNGKHTKKTCKKRGHNCFVQDWADPCASTELQSECHELEGKWLGKNANLDSWTKDTPSAQDVTQFESACCDGERVKCMACKAQVTREQFCEKKPHTRGCPTTPTAEQEAAFEALSKAERKKLGRTLGMSKAEKAAVRKARKVARQKFVEGSSEESR